MLRVCRVRDFEVIDKTPFGIEFSWEKDGQPVTSVLFERNTPIPSVKQLTFYRCVLGLLDNLLRVRGWRRVRPWPVSSAFERRDCVVALWFSA